MPDIGSIAGLGSAGISGLGGIGAGGTKPAGGDLFGKMVGDAIANLNGMQQNADQLATSLAAGENVDIHDVVLAQEQTNLAFQTALQVRNKVVDAYQEVMRMQV
jgi:flagellar hook-basal body complex protein FliE